MFLLFLIKIYNSKSFNLLLIRLIKINFKYNKKLLKNSLPKKLDVKMNITQINVILFKYYQKNLKIKIFMLKI